jgi:hypothetical protein
MPDVVPIGPGPESVVISIYAADPTGARWDQTVWDGGAWAAIGWQSVGCDIGEAVYKWGASAEAGILSVAEAGEIDLRTIDPNRELDPLNTASPYFGYVRPGVPVRIRGTSVAERAASTAIIDLASYDLASGRGRIRAIDGIAYLAQAQLPDGVTLPDTLRARTRAIVAGVGLAGLVPVEPEAPADPDVDPPVAPHDLKAASAWQLISNAAQDALVYVYLDPTGMLRFRSWGAFPDAKLSIGCPPGDADPADQWLRGISTLEATSAADAVRNSVRAYSSGTTFAPAVIDGVSMSTYGPRPLDVQRVVPDRATWASRILADRGDAGLEVAVGEVRPYTPTELAALLQMGLDGPAVIRVRDDAHGDVVDLDVGLIGATVGISPAGWRFQLVTMISRVEWDSLEPEPPIPPIPPPDPWHTETRTYIATSDALLALTSGGAKYGAGAAATLPVGGWQGWTYRSCIKFPSIPWTKVRALKTATLQLRTTTQVRVGFGSNPKAELRRITESWSAGSASSPSSGNAVVWPGPSTTTSGAVTSPLPSGQNVDKSIRCDAIVRAWAPSSIGGSGAAQNGIELRETGNIDNTTTEVWPVEQGGGARPTLVLELEVFD